MMRISEDWWKNKDLFSGIKYNFNIMLDLCAENQVYSFEIKVKEKS